MGTWIMAAGLFLLPTSTFGARRYTQLPRFGVVVERATALIPIAPRGGEEHLRSYFEIHASIFEPVSREDAYRAHDHELESSGCTVIRQIGRWDSADWDRLPELHVGPEVYLPTTMMAVSSEVIRSPRQALADNIYSVEGIHIGNAQVEIRCQRTSAYYAPVEARPFADANLEEFRGLLAPYFALVVHERAASSATRVYPDAGL